METIFKKQNGVLLMQKDVETFEPVNYSKLLALYELSEFQVNILHQVLDDRTRIIKEIIACFDEVESKEQLFFYLVEVLHKNSLIDYEGE